MMEETFKRKILNLLDEDGLEETMLICPNEYLININLWTEEMINKVISITKVTKQEFIEMINDGDLLLIKENYENDTK